jgi:hypothetical protein
LLIFIDGLDLALLQSAMCHGIPAKVPTVQMNQDNSIDCALPDFHLLRLRSSQEAHYEALACFRFNCDFLRNYPADIDALNLNAYYTLLCSSARSLDIVVEPDNAVRIADSQSDEGGIETDALVRSDVPSKHTGRSIHPLASQFLVEIRLKFFESEKVYSTRSPSPSVHA